MLTIKTADRVMELLKEYPALRDDDQYLLAMVWREEVGDKGSAFELLTKIANHEVAHFESVRRERQKIQEKNPDLRGKKYKARHKHAKQFVPVELDPIDKHVTPQRELAL